MKKTITFFRILPLMMLLILLMGNIRIVLSQGTLSNPIFQENFGTLANGTALSTSNTTFSFIRVGTSTSGTSLNQIIASNPGSFTNSSGLISAKGTSISTVDKTGLTSFTSGTFTFKFRTPSSLTSAVMLSAVGTGSSFGSSNGFTGAQLSAAFQVSGTNLQVRSAGAWTTVQTVAVNTNYEICIVFNNTAGGLIYGDSKTLPSNKCHVWINGTYVNEYTTATAGLAASAFRIYTTTSQFEVDDISVYNTLPSVAITAPTTPASSINFSSVDQNGMTASWTNGNGAKRVVIMNTSNSFTTPTDGTDPTANTVYSGSGEQVVYNGSGTSVAITGLSASTTYYFRVYEYNGSSTTTKYLSSTGTNNPNSQTTNAATSPLITATGTINAFANTVINATSAEQSYTVQGANLTGDITITPPTGFQISKTSGSGFVSNPTSLTFTSGEVASAQTVYVRFAPTAIQAYSGNITHTSTGATQVDKAVNGTGVKAEPTDHATSFTASANSSSQITLTWTDATGTQVPDGYLIIASTSTPTTPVDGTAQTDATLVKNITQGTQQAVFTGLSASTTYNFSIWPYTNSGTAIDYKLGSEPTTSATTLLQPWTEDFEAGTKTSYTAGDITCTKGSWNISEALIGTSASDRKNGLQSIRLRYSSGSVFGELKMNFDKDGAGTVTISHAKYGTDIDGSWKLQMSIDGGSSWSDVGSTINTTSTTLTTQSFTINQSGNARFKIVQLSGNRINIDDFVITDYSAPANTTWTGNTSTNWDLSLNWNNGSPSNTTSVTIADVANDPVINNAVVVSSLTLNTSSVLSVSAGKQLTVSGTLTNNGTLNLLSTTAGTATLNATAVSGDGTANVSQYLSSARNWYVSSPVTAAVAPSGYTYYQRDEAGASWVTQPFVAGNTFIRGKGYIALPGAAGSTLTFSGKLNVADTTVALTWSGSTSKGFNLIGNPYPCHLTWTKAFTDANVSLIEPSIYYRTNSGTVNNSGQWSNPTYNAFSGASVGGATGVIPPMQAIWVRAVAAGNLALDNKLTRSHESSNPMKAPAVTTSQNLRLVVSDGTSSDEMLVYFNSNASNAYDAYDSPKMINGVSSVVPDMYTMVGNEELVINGMSTIPAEIPLYIKPNASTSGQFSLRATEVSNFEAGTQVYIKNSKTGEQQLVSDGSVYSFDITADPLLSIIIKAPGAVTGLDNPTNTFNVYANAKGQLTVVVPAVNDGDVARVYNSAGQCILNQSLTNSRTMLNKFFTAGVYVVKVNETIRKVVIE